MPGSRGVEPNYCRFVAPFRPTRKTLLLLVALLLSPVGTFGSDALPPLPEPPRGTLIICGGGPLPDRVFDEFVQAAGGKKARIVVVPTASEDAELYLHLRESDRADELLARWRDRSPAAVQLFHARNRAEADNAAKLKPLEEATGIWFEEGSQVRLAETYVDTKFHDALRAVLARDGVVGGTSAGAAVMTDPMIAGDGPTQADKRHKSSMPQLARGFGLLPAAIVDQHFLARRRGSRLQAAVAADPLRVGFGIDERTAIVVRGRSLSVIGESSVTILVDPKGRRPLVRRLTDGEGEDLIALHRAARSRLAEPFPPPTFASHTVPHGSLVVVGGGRFTEEAQRKFVELAGGAKAMIVVVNSADDRSQTSSEVPWLTKAGVKNIVVMQPRTPAEAEAPQWIAHLRQATGVWFGGGRQWRIVDAFEGSACYEAFHDVLRRGGVIGGSSAGATIQGEYLVRGSPVGNMTMMADGYERGFAFWPGAAVDQHFTERKRLPDLQLLHRTHPQLLAVGIDEATTVVVRGDGFEVLGPGSVTLFAPRAVTGDSSSENAASNDHAAGESPVVLRARDRYDLRRLRLIQSAE